MRFRHIHMKLMASAKPVTISSSYMVTSFSNLFSVHISKLECAVTIISMLHPPILHSYHSALDSTHEKDLPCHSFLSLLFLWLFLNHIEQCSLGSVTLLKIMGCLSFCGLIVLVLSSPPPMGTFYIVFPHRRLRLNPHLCHAEQFPGESSVQVSFWDPQSIIFEYNISKIARSCSASTFNIMRTTWSTGCRNSS